MSVEMLEKVASDQPRPRVSVVLPTYKRAEALQHTLPLLLAQTERDIEIIVMDDCSPDHTANVVKSFADSRLRYVRNASNLKIPGNVNQGIRYSRGTYVMICHDHDVYAPTLLMELANHLDQHATALFVQSGRYGVRLDGSENGVRWVMDYAAVTSGAKWLETMLRRFASPVTGLCMVRRSAFETYGLFDPEFGWSSDVELWMRLCFVGDVGYVPKPLIGIRERAENERFWGVNWELVDEIFRIHKTVRPRAQHAAIPFDSAQDFQKRIDRDLLINFLTMLVRHDATKLLEAETIIQRHGSASLVRVFDIVRHVPYRGLQTGARLLNRVRKKWITYREAL